MLPPNLDRALAKGTVMSCLFYYFILQTLDAVCTYNIILTMHYDNNRREKNIWIVGLV